MRLLAAAGSSTFRLLRRAAKRGWRQRLHALDAAGRAEYVTELDELVRVLAYLLAHPGFPASVLVRAGRQLEERDPRKVTAALLGDLR